MPNAFISKIPKKRHYTIIIIVHRRGTEDAEGMFFYLAGRRFRGPLGLGRDDSQVKTPAFGRRFGENQLSVLSALRLYPNYLVILLDMAELILIFKVLSITAKQKQLSTDN